jgi:lysozyme
VDRIMVLNRRQLLLGGAGAALAPLGLKGARPGRSPAPAKSGRTPPPGYPSGFDVSNYQGSIDWDSAAYYSGASFAFCKATEGTTFLDPWFYNNWAWMYYEGLYRGAYHYGRPAYDPRAQADFFVNVVQPQSGDLQMCLDLETTDGRSPAQVWAWTQAFIDEIYRLTGAPGIIYTGFYFWRDSVGNPSDNLNCPLWLAAWVSDPNPYVPRAWGTWSFWQYTSSGRIPGISGNVDLDLFNGGLDRLALLTIP